VEVITMEKPKIVRQRTLFDDENSDLNYLKEELKKLRLKEIKEKEKKAEEKYHEELKMKRR
jgi:hypothetical protein